MFKVEAVVVGAGVIGLAIARALALHGVKVVLLEKESVAGTGTSSRNSEVIHSGIYYEPESLKALLCVRGRRMMYNYCDERRVPHRQCGKLVVATDPSEDAQLGYLLQRAEKNGVEEIELIGAARLKSLESHYSRHQRTSVALLRNCRHPRANAVLSSRRRGSRRHNRFSYAGPRGDHGRPHNPAQDRRKRIHGA